MNELLQSLISAIECGKVTVNVGCSCEGQGGSDRSILTPPEVGKMLGADPATVINWIRSGQLKASNLATGARPRFVIRPADLDRFLDSRQLDLRKRKAA